MSINSGRAGPSGLGRSAVWLAWALWTLAVAQVVAGLLLANLNRLGVERLFAEFVVSQITATVAFATVGALIVTRRPGNSIGWLFAVIGVGSGMGAWIGQYTRYTLFTEPGALPAGTLVSWLVFWAWMPFVVLAIVFLPLLYPTGRLPSPRWRPVAGLAIVAMVLLTLSSAITPGPIDSSLPDVSNPYPLEGHDSLLAALSGVAVALMAASLASAIAAQVTRYRRARGDERAQIKWFAYATVLLVGSFAIPVAIGYPDFSGSTLPAGIMLALAYPGLPVATGIAILRYRLWDIDWIINHTLVYAVLSGLLLASYGLSVITLQGIFRAVTGQRSELAIILSTLLVAVLFQPLRRWVQRFIDRRFYRRRYNATRTLADFGAHVRDEIDLPVLTGALVSVVRETMQPTTISLWLPESSAGVARPVTAGIPLIPNQAAGDRSRHAGHSAGDSSGSSGMIRISST
jgi:hypothetical protein